MTTVADYPEQEVEGPRPFSGWRINSDNGARFHYLNDKFHREDGPAVVWPDGSQFWFKNGNQHREDGPAIIWEDGREEFWVNGKLIDPLKFFVNQQID